MLRKSFSASDVLSILGGIDGPIGVTGGDPASVIRHLAGSDDYDNARLHHASVRALREQNKIFALANDDARRYAAEDLDGRAVWAKKWQAVMRNEFPNGVAVKKSLVPYAHALWERAVTPAMAFAVFHRVSDPPQTQHL